MEDRTLQTAGSMGKFIALEGIDGCGKSTQTALLVARLKAAGVPVYGTREPTDSPFGSLIHQIMTGRISADNRVTAALFVADRLDHLLNAADGILEKVRRGVNVVTDRYYFSSYAYQSVDLPVEWVIGANSQSAELLRPTATVFLDVDPERALRRISAGRDRPELFETRERLVQVRKNYLAAFDRLKETERVVTVDGNGTPEEVAEAVWEKVSALLRAE